MSKVMSRLLKKIESGEIAVPSLPTVAAKIIELTADEDVSIEKIVEIIEKSQSIVVQLLKVANSTFYRAAKEIKTIQGAVVRVGLNLVKSAILNISLLDVFKGGEDSSKMQNKVWEESFTMAVCARSLARRTNYRNPEEAFTVGLLTHVGIMIMLSVVGKDYLELLREKFYGGKDLNILEHKAYQTDHVEVGYFVLSRWNFPELIKEVVKHHDSQEILSSSNERLVELAKIIHVAEKMAGFFVAENPALNKDISGLCKLFFDMNEKEVEQFLQHIQQEVNGAASLLGLDRILDKSYDQIYRSAIEKLADLNIRYDKLNRNLSQLEEERKQAEQALRESQKIEAVATLAGGIAHEFNNTLVGISGNIDLLQMDLPDDKNVSKYAERMRASALHMAHLTDQLLAYARGGKYQPKTISLTDLVEETLPLIKQTIAPSIRLETDLPHDILNVEADLTQMQMVLSAILNNSAEAIEEKGRIRITTRDEEIDEEFAKNHPGLKPGPYVSLTVEDDGKGMDKETRAKIFDPFFTTKFQGRGLGMAAVYGIVTNHGGWISVDSELGKGTVVRIYLPAVKVEVKEVEKPKIKPAKGTGTILVIEDEDVVIDVIVAMLEKLGYHVLLAKTGKEAIKTAKSFDADIDLAILDILLPDLAAKEVYREIMEARPNLKVIVCSGYAIDGPPQEIMDAGAQDFIQKPFSYATLSEKLKEVLEGK